MITTAIGRMFLEIYNETYGTNYDARTFFVEKFYPLFFDHNKYMMTGGNSPLENPKLSWEKMIRGSVTYETAEQRKQRFVKLMTKIDECEPDMSIARGFSSADVLATTSGQVTDMDLSLREDDVFLSWLGDGLGVGVQGGFSILFCDKSILMDVFKGWKYYRLMLDNTQNAKGNQINTWNGKWLSHYYNDDMYDESNPIQGLDVFTQNKDGILSIETLNWTDVLVKLAQKDKAKQLMGAIYSIGQTNTTIGFIPFELDKIRKPRQLYKQLFANIKGKQNVDGLWGTAFGFRTACTKGVIGVEAMEPKGLRPYITRGTMPKTAKNEEQTINYNVYKTWLLAMLNNDALWDKSQQLAHLLMEASTDKSKEISTKSKNLVNNVLGSTNKKQFINCITEIVPLVSDKKTLTDIVRDIHNMPNDNVPYFLTLLRFQYATND
mgnify:FL=1